MTQSEGGGGGAENTFSQKLFIIFKKWGGGETAPQPLAFHGPCIKGHAHRLVVFDICKLRYIYFRCLSATFLQQVGGSVVEGLSQTSGSGSR